jgi:hypothetical protein
MDVTELPAYVRALGDAMRATGAVRAVLAAGPVRELVLGPSVAASLDGEPAMTQEQLAERAETILYASAVG